MDEPQASAPVIRWGILGAGNISSLFVKDLLVARHDPPAPVRHVVQAIGTSSVEKGTSFIQSAFTGDTPHPIIYTDYTDLYTDDKVDVVYVGVPHSLHKEACLEAITAGKHVLCEKPLAINLGEVEEIIKAAQANSVFVMEAVWTRFLPSVLDLQHLIHQEKVIGDVKRVFCDFAADAGIETLPPTHRLLNPQLGGGALLDLGVYPFALASVILDHKVGADAECPEVSSSMVVVEGVDYSNVMVLKYPSKQALAILTSSFQGQTPGEFCRIEGTKGTMALSGIFAACPGTITITRTGETAQVRSFKHTGVGFYFEADAVALDIVAGRLESKIMPLSESARVFGILDAVRQAGGVVYPQDV